MDRGTVGGVSVLCRRACSVRIFAPPMLNLDNLAVTFGRALEVFRREPASVPDQKAALRAMVALMRLDGAVVRAVDGELVIGERRMPPTLPGVRLLLTQCEAHDVEEIRIAKGAAPASLLHLLRVLATPPGRPSGGEDVARRLAAAAVDDITVVVQAPAVEPPDPVLEARAIMRPLTDVTTDQMLDAGPERGRRDSGPEGVVAAIAPAAAASELPGQLARARDAIADAMRRGDVGPAIRAVGRLVEMEGEAPAGERRDLLAREVNDLLDAELLRALIPATRDAAVLPVAMAVFERSGRLGLAVLIDALLAAEDLDERRSVFALLAPLPAGVRTLILQLQAPDSDRIRRAADALGQLDVREAAPGLCRVAVHTHRGVRDAVARALAILATPDAIEGLGRLLNEQDRDLRIDAARAVGGARLEDLVGPLEAAARRHPDPADVLEYGRALGRIATPAAVGVLVRWASAPGWRFWRRNTGLRLAAVEGLRAVGGPGAREVLRGLQDDADADVRRAAAEALEDVSIAARTSGT